MDAYARACVELADFLLARIAEEEAVAGQWPEDAVPPGAMDSRGHPIWGARSRVLAECDAKREIVQEFARLSRLTVEDEVAREEAETRHPVSDRWRELAERDLMVSREVLAAVCRLLARPYAQHSDYRRDDWRPVLV